MDQVKKLWDKEGVKGDGGLPILFNIFDNFYGMGGQTQGETMGFDMAARIGAGFSPDALLAERVNGYDPLAVADAVARQKKISHPAAVLLFLMLLHTAYRDIRRPTHQHTAHRRK